MPRESEPHAGGEVGRSQAGHKTGPAACFELAESERHAGREVGRSQCGLKTSPAACLKPHESGRAWTGGSSCSTGRELDSREYIFWQTPASAGITDRKCLMSSAGARVCGLVAIEKVSSAHALVAGTFGYWLPMVQSGAEQVLFNGLWIGEWQDPSNNTKQSNASTGEARRQKCRQEARPLCSLNVFPELKSIASNVL